MNKINRVIFETKTSFNLNAIYFWLINIIVMLTIFLYSIFHLPLYLGIPYIVIAFYLIFIKFFQYKLFRFFYKIEFNEDNQLITFYYRDHAIKTGKYLLPYSEIELRHRKTILSTSVFIKDKRKGKGHNVIGVVNKESFWGTKYWNKKLYNSLVEKLESVK